jgi:2-hydroxy-6-oxonona-2,4-dienedioate hydrolase
MDERAYRGAEQRLWGSVAVQPTERTVRLPTLGVRVRVQEAGAGEPVLYIHGGPNSGSTWAPVVARTVGLRSLLVDRPGTGLSEPLQIGPGELTRFADVFVADVLDAMEIERAHVVASSFGGFTALRSAAATPDRIEAMVQMACPAGAPGMALPGFMKAIAVPGLGRLIATLPPNERANRSIMRQIGHGKSLDAGRLPPAFLDWYLALQRHTDTMRHETRMIASLLSPTGRVHPALALTGDVLARATVPTSFLWGADDTFGGEAVAREMVAALPDAQVEMMADAGHLPWLDDPAHAARFIEAFLLRRTTRQPTS